MMVRDRFRFFLRWQRDHPCRVVILEQFIQYTTSLPRNNKNGNFPNRVWVWHDDTWSHINKSPPRLLRSSCRSVGQVMSSIKKETRGKQSEHDRLCYIISDDAWVFDLCVITVKSVCNATSSTVVAADRNVSKCYNKRWCDAVRWNMIWLDMTVQP